MKKMMQDFLSFIQSLSFIDIMFILSILGLVILVVTLIYIVKVNDEDTEELEDNNINGDKKNNIEIVDEANTDEELDLVSLTKELDDKHMKPLTLNDYEKEQEEKAIISYDELLKTKDLTEDINYIEEKNLDGLTVKAVDTQYLTKPIELPKIKEKLKKTPKEEIDEEVKVEKSILISYEKEEEFLATLKKLEKLLN